VTHSTIADEHPEWIEAFVSTVQKFELYSKKRRQGAAGAANETTKIAKEVFYFLMSRATQEFIARKISKTMPSHNVLYRQSRTRPLSVSDDYDFDREFVGFVRASDIVETVLPSRPRLGSDSPNAKTYPHKNKTLIYRVLSEMVEHGLLDRVGASRKKTFYRVRIFSVDRESGCANCSLWVNRYYAAIEIMKENGIPSPEQQIDARLYSKCENSV